MIIFRTADDMLAAIHVAQVFDKHGLCVVSMGQVEKAQKAASKEAPFVLHSSLPPEKTWLIVGQGSEVDITQINADIAEKDPGYSEEEPDDGLGSETTH